MATRLSPIEMSLLRKCFEPPLRERDFGGIVGMLVIAKLLRGIGWLCCLWRMPVRSLVAAGIALVCLCLLGSLYPLPSAAQQLAFRDLYTFPEANWKYENSGGAQPRAGLIQARDGNLYGTTWLGGPNGDGVVFRITKAGQLTVLHSFSGPDGADPVPDCLVQASDGNLYGTTYHGGANGQGAVFRITTSGDLTLMHSFSGPDGGQPWAGLIQASDGNLYGTTSGGGPDGGGVVFRMTTSGSLTVLYPFLVRDPAPDGAEPYAGLIQASDGNLYGTTEQGGAKGDGVVFRVSTSGDLTVLHSFSGPDGAGPYAGLIQASDGNLYGTTSGGGPDGGGVVFRMTTSGSLTVLHSFPGQTPARGGFQPYGGLVQASSGNLSGTTMWGGADFGVVFRITTAGHFTVVHSFSEADGVPYGTLIQGSDGALYGTANGDTKGLGGAVFRLKAVSTH